jgi:hypothetical protein
LLPGLCAGGREEKFTEIGSVPAGCADGVKQRIYFTGVLKADSFQQRGRLLLEAEMGCVRFF